MSAGSLILPAAARAAGRIATRSLYNVCLRAAIQGNAMIDKLLQRRPMLACMLALALVGGCTAPSGAPADASSAHSHDVKLAYVDWSSCSDATHVVKAVLEQEGFRVKTVLLTGAAMYSALAQGDADATVCAWLPSTHAAYYARAQDRLINLGPNMAGTRIGLVVPDYVSIDTIDQLAAHADQFGHRIVGIDPDAGEMGIARKAIETYQLPLKLVEGTDASMAAALGRAIGARQWIVVTDRLDATLDVGALEAEISGRSQGQFRRCRRHRHARAQGSAARQAQGLRDTRWLPLDVGTDAASDGGRSAAGCRCRRKCPRMGEGAPGAGVRLDQWRR